MAIEERIANLLSRRRKSGRTWGVFLWDALAFILYSIVRNGSRIDRVTALTRVLMKILYLYLKSMSSRIEMDARN